MTDSITVSLLTYRCPNQPKYSGTLQLLMESHVLKYMGQNVNICPLVRIVKPEAVEIDDSSVIDDYSYINGGAGVKSGKHVHISGFVSVVGGGRLIIEDYATIGYGTKIVTARDTQSLEDTLLSDLLEVKSDAAGNDTVIIEKGALIGNDVVIHPNVRICERAVIESYSHISEDVTP